MDTTENTANVGGTKSGVKEPLDPLRRVFVPIEKRMTNGNMTFQTSDKERYYRTSDGVILRVAPKINGKKAKKERRKLREQEKKNDSR